jgi:hypothetical protein
MQQIRSSFVAVRNGLPLLALAVLLLSGCARIRKTRDCQALARVVNRRLDEIAEIDKRTDPNRYSEIAKRYELLSRELKNLSLREPDLVQQLPEYSATYNRAAGAARRAAGAVKGNNDHAMTQVAREFERVGQREKTLARKIDAECRGP